MYLQAACVCLDHTFFLVCVWWCCILMLADCTCHFDRAVYFECVGVKALQTACDSAIARYMLPVLVSPSWQDSGWRVQASDVVGRRDLRGERVMSVDPPGCQDIDDAMHVTRKPNGKLEVSCLALCAWFSRCCCAVVVRAMVVC